VVLLPGAFLLLCESKFGATVHDDAHNAFMTLSPYTCTREGEVPQLGSSLTLRRVGFGVRKRDVCADMEADENILFTGEMLSLLRVWNSPFLVEREDWKLTSMFV